MADVFISYAHEDQAFVKRMVPALEAEGFSVWWDHTIPPGQSWDSFIARGIKEAKAAIVVWSNHSVGSEWVKEEATLARGGSKYLPIQIDSSVPPMGFSRIQAANLSDWNGDSENPQWQMLLREARELCANGGMTSAQSRAPVYHAPQPRTPPRRDSMWLFAGLAAAAGGGAVLTYLLVAAPSADSPTDAQSAELAPPAASEVVDSQPRSSTSLPPREIPVTNDDETRVQFQAELERLRSERDAALRAAQQASVQAQQSASTPATAAPRPPEIDVGPLLGTWKLTSGSPTDCHVISHVAGPDWLRLTMVGSNLVWEHYERTTWVTNASGSPVRTDDGRIGFSRHYDDRPQFALTSAGLNLYLNGSRACTFARETRSVPYN